MSKPVSRETIWTKIKKWFQTKKNESYHIVYEDMRTGQLYEENILALNPIEAHYLFYHPQPMDSYDISSCLGAFGRQYCEILSLVDAYGFNYIPAWGRERENEQAKLKKKYKKDETK